MRTNVILPEEIIKEIDKIAGERKRSAFLVEAAKEKLTREKFKKVSKKVFGIFKDYLEFSSGTKVRSYIRKFRKENSYRF